MKSIRQWIVLVTLLAAVGFILTGCDTGRPDDIFDSTPEPPGPVQELRISALTEFVYLPDNPQVQLRVMAELMDAAEQSVQQPCIWRFELYDFVARSSQIRGHRITIWPDMDLTAASEDDTHWKPFLKGYEFYLPLEHELQGGKKYVLEATAMTDQRRYNDLFEIIYLP